MSVVAATLLTCTSAICAGGVGHYYVARVSAARIMQSPDVPLEFRQALKDPASLNAFCNGAIAPDLECLVDKSHHGKTTRLFGKLLDTAMVALQEAEEMPDVPAKAAKVKEASKSLCFAAGWLSHCATDFAVHPTVNARAGDVYEFCSTAQKGIHTTAEIQLSRHLANTYKKPDWKIAFDIPCELVSKASGVSDKQLKASVKVMRMKLAAELLAMDKVTIPKTSLAKEWETVVGKAIEDTVAYVASPGLFKDYDLDYGPISTADLKELRVECIGINEGKLPSQWGKEYMNWWSIVQPMNATARHDKLVELIKGRQALDGRQIIVTPGGSIEADFYVNGVNMACNRPTVLKMPANGILRVQVSADTGKKWRCRTRSSYTGNNVRVIEQTPYSLHYTSTSRNKPYEYDLSLRSETYSWRTAYTWNTRYGAGTGTAYSTGKHPRVKNDVYEWKLPRIDKIQGGKEYLYLHIEANLDWDFYTTDQPKKIESERNIMLVLKVEMPAN